MVLRLRCCRRTWLLQSERCRRKTFVNQWVSWFTTPLHAVPSRNQVHQRRERIPLIAGSKLPSAEKFESWIFDELVPETLKNGGYLLKKNGETDNELLARAILLAQNRIKERDSRISALEKENNYAILKLKLQAPKVQYYDKVLQSQSTYTTTQIAKELGMTAGMLNKRLRWAGIQFRQSGQWLLKAPYQNQGYTATRTHVWESRTGETGTAMLTVWTEKGRLFIHYLFEAYLV